MKGQDAGVCFNHAFKAHRASYTWCAPAVWHTCDNRAVVDLATSIVEGQPVMVSECRDLWDRLYTAVHALDLTAAPLRYTWIKAHTDRDPQLRQQLLDAGTFTEREFLHSQCADEEADMHTLRVNSPLYKYNQK